VERLHVPPDHEPSGAQRMAQLYPRNHLRHRRQQRRPHHEDLLMLDLPLRGPPRRYVPLPSHSGMDRPEQDKLPRPRGYPQPPPPPQGRPSPQHRPQEHHDLHARPSPQHERRQTGPKSLRNNPPSTRPQPLSE